MQRSAGPQAKSGRADRRPLAWARRLLAGGLGALLAGLALMTAGLPAQAQNLHVLVKAARGHDTSFLAAQLQADAAHARLGQALALARPSVNVTVGSTQSHADTPWNALRSTHSSQHTAGLQAQWTVFNRADDRKRDQAEVAQEVARAQLKASEQDLFMRVTQAYFEVLSATDALATVRVSKQAIEEQVAAARKNFEVGMVTITDAREAEARLDLARAQEISAENDLLAAQVVLDQAVGQAGRRPAPLAQPVQLPPLAPADVEDWVRLAQTHSPLLQQLKLGVSLAELEARKAEAARLPTVALTATLQLIQARISGQTQATDGTSAPYGPNSGSGPSGSVGVQMSMPLYAGGGIGEQVREARALAGKSEAELEGARRSVAQATRIAFFGLRSLMAKVQALQAAEASSQLALEATQLGYQVGVRVGLDVLNAQTQVFQARRDLARARYEVLVGLLRLKQTAGVLGDSDIAGVNRLLAG